MVNFDNNGEYRFSSMVSEDVMLIIDSFNQLDIADSCYMSKQTNRSTGEVELLILSPEQTKVIFS